MDDKLALANSVLETMFPKVLGMTITEATPDRIVAELTVREELCTTGRTLHGGAIMTMADFLGAGGTFFNLPPGAGTTTIESKTNFVGSAKVGDTVTAVCEPVHKGKSTQVWRTTIKHQDGRLVAVVQQTQMVMQGGGGPTEPLQVVQSLFQGKTPAEQKALLSQLERGGAAIYRQLAANETDEARKADLLRAAEKEEENARTLEDQV